MNEIRRRIPALLVLAAVSAVLLSGCLYPKENLAQNKASTREAVRNMQAVIEEFQQATGVLPLKNSTPETPRYEKFVIDLAKLQNMQYISDLPAVSFEKGGKYYFLIQNEESEPTVKLMDLVVYQAANQIQGWVDSYKREQGSLPLGSQAYPGFYYIDYGKLGQKEPVIQSIYSGLTLPAIINESGTVFVDYGIDIMQAVQRTQAEPQAGDDLRELLVASSELVPVKSTAYHWIDGDPQAVAEKNGAATQ
ncbi:hypothetical protein [Paenibacillus sp. SYP-B4298]|uniref:hypothetical protein n=1 Tax=Paenibacillus sp. SYP-B4298 TaxID=2996034 RepID=UPI0022DE604F|nr:hypothetical protein [Paenibacillus sp. SYP-B4298]